MEKGESVDKVLVDESVLRLDTGLEYVKRRGSKILLHRALMKWIELKAFNGDTAALEGLKKFTEFSGVELVGSSVEGVEWKEALIEYSMERHYPMITSDPVLAKVASSMGVDCHYLPPTPPLNIEEVFKEDVMSLHMKEGLPPRIKRGHPGAWVFEEITQKRLTRVEIEAMITSIMQQVYNSFGTEVFVEIEKPDLTILQLREYRIVITRPPLSDGFEITVVRPIKRIRLEDYNLPHKALLRLAEKAEGILVAGPPGMGKSTFAQALAEYYRGMNKVVKTIESPRDLRLPPDITQYSKAASKEHELHHVLLLSRPDYTVFDEMREPADFETYIDLRYAGIGMIGVIHASSPIDALHRIANRVDIGILPSIVDTLIFMDKGNVASIHTLEVSVKVPTGMKRADLARPTVIVKNFLTEEPEYELYVFGERVFFIPLKEQKQQDRRLKVFQTILSKHLSSYTATIEDETLKITIPEDEVRTYVKKCQNKVLKVARRMKLDVEAYPERI